MSAVRMSDCSTGTKGAARPAAVCALFAFLWAPLLKALPTNVLKEKKPVQIVIDAGHGGKDLGALGFFHLLEKDLCLSLEKLVRSELNRLASLKHLPIEVSLSRETDNYLTLSERVHLANESSADVFVSLHGNSSPNLRARGFEVYFLSTEATDEAARRLARAENLSAKQMKSEIASMLSSAQANHHIVESSELAETLFHQMARSLKPNGKGIRQAPFAVLEGTMMPAVLVEVGYLTNPMDAHNLLKASYLKQLANAISMGILDFVGMRKRMT